MACRRLPGHAVGYRRGSAIAATRQGSVFGQRHSDTSLQFRQVAERSGLQSRHRDGGQRGHVHPGPYAQLEGVPGDLVVVGRLDDADEVLVSQHAVHAQDLGIMGLDGGGGPHEAFGVLEHPLATVQRQRQQQDI